MKKQTEKRLKTHITPQRPHQKDKVLFLFFSEKKPFQKPTHRVTNIHRITNKF